MFLKGQAGDSQRGDSSRARRSPRCPGRQAGWTGGAPGAAGKQAPGPVPDTQVLTLLWAPRTGGPGWGLSPRSESQRLLLGPSASTAAPEEAGVPWPQDD